MRYWRITSSGYYVKIAACKLDTAMRRAVRSLCEGEKITKHYSGTFHVESISQEEYEQEEE